MRRLLSFSAPAVGAARSCFVPGDRALNEWRSGSAHFEQARGTLSAANAHRDHDVFHLSSSSFDQRVSHESCTGCSVRMSDSNGASVDIQTLIRDSEAVAAVENLHGEGFVELPQADVFHLDARTLQQPGYGKDGADAHFIRFASGDGEAPEDAERLDSALFRKLRVHDHAGARAIRELAGVAGSDHAAGKHS